MALLEVVLDRRHKESGEVAQGGWGGRQNLYLVLRSLKMERGGNWGGGGRTGGTQAGGVQAKI